MILPIGPIHPGLKEPLRLKLQTQGEKVIKAEIDYGYVHRGIEKIMEGKTWQKCIYLSERICGICSYEHTQTFAETLESISGVQAPLRAQYLRVITNELDRIQSHLLANSTFFKTLDHETLFMHVLALREYAMDSLELLTGNRVNLGWNVVGGVRMDAEEKHFDAILANLKKIEDGFDRHIALFEEAPIVALRAKGVGVMTKEEAIKGHAVGPIGRASGLKHDLREMLPMKKENLAMLCDYYELTMGNGYFVSRLEAIKTKKASVKLDNNIFFEENTPVSGSVLRTNVSYYNHGLFKLNFSDSSSLDKANSYISEKSGGKAKELLSALSGNMTLSGTTVISDSWLGCFDESGSDMLTGTEYLLKGKSCKGFIKDFKGTPCKFVALLPDKDISDLLKALNSESYSEIIESMNIFKTADVSIAPFKLESCEDYSGLIKKSGVSEIFDDGSFSGLTFRKTASTGAIAQYCSVNINAAGVNTSDKVKAKSKKQEAETKLSFDRPYVFFIIDNESNIPIISGIKG